MYADVVRDAADGGAALERFREPLGDDRYVRFAEPIAMTAEDPDALAAAADAHPGFHAGDGYVTIISGGEMLATYDVDEGSVSIDGDVLHSITRDRDPGPLGRVVETVRGDRNPIYRRGRDRAAGQDLDDAGEWLTRSRRTSYGILGLTAAAAVSGGYGILSGEPAFLELGAGLAASEIGFMGTYGAYAGGGTDEMMDRATSRRADAIDDRAGDTVVHADTSRVIDAWIDSIDPDAETPAWLE